MKKSALRLERKIKSTLRWLADSMGRLRIWLSRETLEYPIFLSILILAIGLLIVFSFYEARSEFREGFWPGVFIEFNGMLFDVLVFGIIVGFFLRATERRREANRQQEIIDDYKKWNSDEGKLRIAGAVRRLNRSGRTNIDFGGIELSKLSSESTILRASEDLHFMMAPGEKWEAVKMSY